MNELKVANINKANAVDAPTDKAEIKNEVKNTSKDTVELTEKNTTEAVVKHVVVYLGNSAFNDNIGHKWHKNDEQTYSDSEYKDRADLHFMVKYGEMKHTVVTM